MKSYIFKYINIKIFLLFSLFLGSCTKNFNDIAVDPNKVSDQLLNADYNSVGVFFPQMQESIYYNFNNTTWEFQLQQNLIGDVYSGYMMPPTPFRGNTNNMNYDLVDGWNGFPFSLAYNNIMGPALAVEQKAKTDFPHFYAISLILKVAGMSRVTDIYGPVPYSQYGKGGTTVEYDSQQKIYESFFNELTTAVTILSTKIDSAPNDASFQKFDLIYGGDLKKWVVFANSLRLRLAMRIVKVQPALAKTQAEMAVSQKYGVMMDNADNANVSSPGKLYHPLNTINEAWNDIRMGAPMESYLVGLNDPRLSEYFMPSNVVSGKYKGIRNGINITSKDDYTPFSKLGPRFALTNAANVPLQLMTSAEMYFLRAEGTLRGWNMNGDVQNLYETGIKKSIAQWNSAADASKYIADNTSMPADYVDPKNPANNSPALSKVTVKWNEALTNEAKLEKIITQKWISVFPDGQEAWSEFRRTGYPKLMTVVINNSGGKISTSEFVRRINFPASEIATNKAAVDNAVKLLGGPDTGGTRLWWDLKTANF